MVRSTTFQDSPKGEEMGKSSIHINPVKAGSEQHNEREKKLNYVRDDLSHLNTSFKLATIAQAKEAAAIVCKEKTGRAMQAKATPVREGVLLIDERHTAADLEKLGKVIEERFGIRTIQGYAHKDEGHFDKTNGEWKPNYHAHMVFDWTDHSTGKSIKMSRDDMAELQTIVARELGLERGISSSVKHLNSIQYKTQEEGKDLERVFKLRNGLPDAFRAIEQGKRAKMELEPLKTQKNALEFETALLIENRDYIKEKSEKIQLELDKLKEQTKSRGHRH